MNKTYSFQSCSFSSWDFIQQNQRYKIQFYQKRSFKFHAFLLSLAALMRGARLTLLHVFQVHRNSFSCLSITFLFILSIAYYLLSYYPGLAWPFVKIATQNQQNFTGTLCLLHSSNRMYLLFPLIPVFKELTTSLQFITMLSYKVRPLY